MRAECPDLVVRHRAQCRDVGGGGPAPLRAVPDDPGAGGHGRLFDASERVYQWSLRLYGVTLDWVMRHRPTHFQHVFAGGGYAAAYYSYMWSEVLDADAFAAFEETDDIFHPATAKNLHDHVYAAGGSRDPTALYTAFRGRLPTSDGLLKRRGLFEQVPDPAA